jgi:hypothetical protein
VAEKIQPGPPMDLANMRSLGVRELFVTCLACGHEADVGVDRHPDRESVPSFASRWPDDDISKYIASRSRECRLRAERALTTQERQRWLEMAEYFQDVAQRWAEPDGTSR